MFGCGAQNQNLWNIWASKFDIEISTKSMESSIFFDFKTEFFDCFLVGLVNWDPFEVKTLQLMRRCQHINLHFIFKLFTTKAKEKNNNFYFNFNNNNFNHFNNNNNNKNFYFNNNFNNNFMKENNFCLPPQLCDQ